MITLALLWLGGALGLCCRDLANEQMDGWPQSRSELVFYMFCKLLWPIAIVLGLVLEDE